jgi:hypothetical protein
VWARLRITLSLSRVIAFLTYIQTVCLRHTIAVPKQGTPGARLALRGAPAVQSTPPEWPFLFTRIKLWIFYHYNTNTEKIWSHGASST